METTIVRTVAMVAALLVAAPCAGCARVDTSIAADIGGDLPDTPVEMVGDIDQDDPGMETPDEGCPGGFTDCGGVCVDLATDVHNCGWCGNECASSHEHTEPACAGSSCGWVCAAGWVDNDGLPGCETPCAGSGVELCNGLDDDCDTLPDDGFACVMGSRVECVTTCGTYGTGTCTMACLPPATCTPPAEECNGIDDDCNGETDEGFPAGTCGSCTPDCSGRECGPDPACATSCGTCTAPETCNSAGECVCVPGCGTRECGPDPVCGLSCGTCTAPEVCDAWGMCSCVPNCTGRVCGPDPVCGTSCGTCVAPTTCDASGHCVGSCTPDCTGRVCGPDPVCGTSCGACTAPATCNSSGQCVTPCVPDCTGRECGLDPVCGESCGTCVLPEICDYSHQCISSCTPDCTGRVCGPDPSCGTSCGTCTAPATCNSSGQCESGCPPPVESCTTGTQTRDRCTNARIVGRSEAGLGGGYSISDSTCDASNRFDDCSWDAGADHAYRIYMLAGESISVYVYADWACSFYDSSWWDLTLKIYKNAGCSDTLCTTRVLCEDHLDSHTEVFTAPHDGWFIVVVDGSTAFEDEGDYDMTIDLACRDAVTCGC